MQKALYILVVFFCLGMFQFPSFADETAAPAKELVLDKVVAVVNNEIITWLELYQSLEFETAGNTSDMDKAQKLAVFKKNEKPYLDLMIQQRLELQEAKRLGIEVKDEEVSAALDNIRKKYGMDEAAFEQAIAKEGLSFDKYRTLIHDQITIGRVVDRAVKQNINLSAEEMRHELERLGLKEGTYYRIQQIFFRLGPGEQYQTIEPKVNAALAALRAGEDFGQVASQYSEGPAAQRGGDLGLVPADQISKEFKQAIEGMSPGDISAPFQTSRGVHIVLYGGTHDVRDVVYERKFDEEYRDWLRRLREKAFVEVRL